MRNFILENLTTHPRDVVRVTAQSFSISPQAVQAHLRHLIAEGAILSTGNTRNRTYKLAALQTWQHGYLIEPGLADDDAWRDVAPHLKSLPDNIRNIWHYCFTEIFNNAIDHSGGTQIYVEMTRTAVTTEALIYDNGVGIFKKIQAAMNLVDPRHSVLELAKGKFTTDPTRHSGEGIFFSSRSVDNFCILSEGVFFTHHHGDEQDWILEDSDDAEESAGTFVRMRLHNHTSRTVRSVFDMFTSDNDSDYGFTKTVVPVRIAQYGDDNLVSRSQAKRLLARIEVFRTVILDFEGVGSVGQAFADEIFRVFQLQHPEVHLVATNASEEIQNMISRAKSGLLSPQADGAGTL